MSTNVVRAIRTLRRVVMAAVLGFTLHQAANAQSPRDSLLQVEVRDSVGLPLPDAKIEVFTLMDRAISWEWVSVVPSQLPEGINLLRFSHPGYRSSTFSVPLRNGSIVALRVRLDAEGDTTKREPLDARAVHATGVAIDGRMKTDVVGRRRILESGAAAEEPTGRFGTLLRRARGTELNVIPISGGAFRPLAENNGGGGRTCQMSVMLNGDRRQVLPFAAFDQLYGTSDLEVMEVFPRGVSLPAAYQVPRAGCGMLVAWFRNL